LNFLLLELGIDLRIQDKISGLSIGSKKNHYIEEKHAAKHQREKKKSDNVLIETLTKQKMLSIDKVILPVQVPVDD
jgi:hypothetical protein